MYKNNNDVDPQVESFFEWYKSFIWDPHYVLYAYYGLLSPGYVYFAPTKLGGRYLPPKKPCGVNHKWPLAVTTLRPNAN